jgi:UDP-N-acetylmuramate dehydrogenase
VPLPADLRAVLAAVPGVCLREPEPVARHGALRIGGDVETYVVVHDEAALLAVAEALRAAHAGLRVLSPLGDAFARDAGLSGVLVRLGPAFGEVEVGPRGIEAGCGAPLASIGAAAARAGLAGWRGLSTWPGSLGAWCSDLDGAALATLCGRIRALTGRGLRDFSGAAVATVPRSALLIQACLIPEAPAALPPRPPWPGAAFAEDPDLLAALARSRLPGLRLRGIRLAEEQVGLVVNLGGGSARDLDLMLRVIVERLGRDHGLQAQPRLQPMGRPPNAAASPKEEST